ncbi:TetR/AcrR family transcriptional regulator [Saccharothrix violaceirubra]|uniref:AcrR family transcriptional regulator n=1 Tax=Saccharothrix violaceirubra TaxID=413306 RepID=A0A7W7SZ97_9PSEU|nr:TetR/AcrR family transcriptional regulator [Saccharothrix violaceirubra]MBB4963087.1 AcrR family transcriptional regulator [Saccharothrix violaceirubra]
MPRPKTHDDALRARLLDRAGELLSSEGPNALSLRRLAADVNTSTTAVYSLFGGKPALLDALYEEAFRRFGERVAAVPLSDDPVENIVRIGLAYRRSALADPQFYLVMFSKVVPNFEPSEETGSAALRTFQPVLDNVRRAIELEIFVAAPEEHIGIAVWGMVHGLVSLELNGNLPAELTIGEMYERAVRANVNGWRR